MSVSDSPSTKKEHQNKERNAQHQKQWNQRLRGYDYCHVRWFAVSVILNKLIFKKKQQNKRSVPIPKMQNTKRSKANALQIQEHGAFDHHIRSNTIRNTYSGSLQYAHCSPSPPSTKRFRVSEVLQIKTETENCIEGNHQKYCLHFQSNQQVFESQTSWSADTSTHCHPSTQRGIPYSSKGATCPPRVGIIKKSKKWQITPKHKAQALPCRHQVQKTKTSLFPKHNGQSIMRQNGAGRHSQKDGTETQDTQTSACCLICKSRQGTNTDPVPFRQRDRATAFKPITWKNAGHQTPKKEPK